MWIESAQNPKIKNLLKVREKSRERKKQGVFLVEGIQENQMAMNSGLEVQEFFVCDEIFNEKLNLDNYKTYKLSSSLFEKIAYRGTTGGVLGLYKSNNNDLEELKLPENPLVVIIEAVEKPGNLGAVLRTCDGAGVDLLIVCDPLVDFYNPNVIRSSVGTVFTNQVVSAGKEEVLNWLRKHQIQIISTFLREDTQSLYEVNLKKPSAIILGTEAFGLSDFWADNSDILIKIPMKGKVDSLNVSNAAAICIYEALRQRN